MVTINRLSSELLCLIMDNVYDEDESLYSIKNCSLVNRLWYSAAVRYVFRCPVLRVDTESKKSLDLLRFLNNRVDLHISIHKIHLEVVTHASYCPETLELACQELLPKLARLKKITLKSSRYTDTNALELDFFRDSFLRNLADLKTEVCIDHACSTYNMSALLLPQIQNLTSIHALLSIKVHTVSRFYPIRTVGRLTLDPTVTGSECLIKVLEKNPTIRDVTLKLGSAGYLGYLIEGDRCIAAVFSRFRHLARLQLNGSFQIFPGALPFVFFEQLRHLSIVGFGLINYVLSHMIGQFPVLEEVRLLTREEESCDGMGPVNRYYSAGLSVISQFFTSIKPKRLTMSGFSAEIVNHLLKELNHGLTQLECHDLDLFSSSSHFPDGLPDLGNESWMAGEIGIDDEDFYEQVQARWRALRTLSGPSKREVSLDHTSKTKNMLYQLSTDRVHHEMRVIGMDIERHHLITTKAKPLAPVDPNVCPASQISENEAQRNQRIASAKLETRGNLMANFELLESLCLLHSVQEISLHLNEIDPQNYWTATIEDLVQTFSFIWSHKVGKPLLKLFVVDTRCESRFLARNAGLQRISIDYCLNLGSSRFQIWDLKPVKRLHKAKTSVSLPCWILDA